MSDELDEKDENINELAGDEVEEPVRDEDEAVDGEGAGGKYDALLHAEEGKTHRITGMFRDWFLDYASYVILERAVPHIEDGLKPVQRRILHAMFRMDDGRFNKVANIIGFTMQFHPHGDASIGDALVQLGQKELLIETQGNFGNILTGDGAAAPRYIEARLSKFALEVAFNPKTTEWMSSYDGRNKEPVTLPMKFPLLLAQGVEGIAVGLASKILPHNFNEIIDAAIAYLRKEPFALYPDFPTSGMADCANYNDGARGGKVKVRARINKIDSKTLAITEIPFGLDTTKLIDSIKKANDKGKIKIKKVDDNTAQNVEILLHLSPDVSPDMTIDALYAFTDCELSISTYACVIRDQHPIFFSVSDILRINTDQTRELLRRELEIRMHELEEDWHYSSLEKIFFEQRIYRELEKDAVSWEDQLAAINGAFDPFRPLLRREIMHEDIVKLTEKPVRRISKFDIKKADEHIKSVEDEMEKVQNDLAGLVRYTIEYFKRIRKKYGAGRERKTELRSFDTIAATRVVIANEKLYANWEEGFVGYGLKKDRYICDCSDLDEIIAIRKDGSYLVSKVSEKAFLGKNLQYVNIFQRNDNRTIYNVIYRDGRNGPIMIKRCAISGITRDREYHLTKGEAGSQLLYFSANPNGEAELLRITLKPRPRMRNLITDVNFADVAIKGRDAQGNILTRYAIHKIALKEKGASTLGGKPVWWDADVQRINEDGRGTLLGEFHGKDKLLIVTEDGNYRTANCDVSLHFEDNIRLIEKYDPAAVFTAVYYDPESKFWYLKRFPFEQSAQLTSFVGEGVQQLKCMSREIRPQFKIVFGGLSKHKPEEIVVADEFITVKSFRAKGKRLSTLEIARVKEIEPLPPAEPAPQQETAPPEPDAPATPPVDRFPDIPFEIEKVEQGTLEL
ncbi:MAG: DNA gyrase/topoisomerase IV subunit A [Bacteroidales bacterium]|jgi:topoisomerase-4 subunit A|nr:DNA gyrase/topoisomerase IV subunit A [Bacteroidales bacterium]